MISDCQEKIVYDHKDKYSKHFITIRVYEEYTYMEF